MLEKLIIIDHPVKLDGKILDSLPALKILGLYLFNSPGVDIYESLVCGAVMLRYRLEMETNIAEYLISGITGRLIIEDKTMFAMTHMSEDKTMFAITHSSAWHMGKANGIGYIKNSYSTKCDLPYHVAATTYWENMIVHETSYIGEFSNGQYHGNGIMKQSSFVYAGTWTHGEPTGNFNVHGAHGIAYRGMINREGEWHGDGILTMLDGRVCDGVWNKGCSVGIVKIIYPDGKKYVGMTHNLSPCGPGTMIMSDDLYRSDEILERNGNWYGLGEMVIANANSVIENDYTIQSNWDGEMYSGHTVKTYPNHKSIKSCEGESMNGTFSGKIKITFIDDTFLISNVCNVRNVRNVELHGESRYVMPDRKQIIVSDAVTIIMIIKDMYSR